MKKLMCTIVIAILSVGGMFLYPEMKAELPEVMKPFTLVVDKDRLYVVEESAIHIYSLKDYKRIKQFGKKGEGPGEFRRTPGLRVFNDNLLINVSGKVMHFSRDGEFLKEQKTPSMRFQSLSPVGENFVGIRWNFNRATRSASQQITLVDKDFKVIKEFEARERRTRGGMSGRFEFQGVRDLLKSDTAGNTFFVADTTKGFYFEVYDAKGSKLYDIKKEYDKLKVTETYKKKIMDRLSNEGRFRRFRDRIKIVFRDDFPAIKDFRIDNGTLLVFTYKTRDEKNEVLFMDLKGKLLKTVWVPDEELSYMDKGAFYYLKENEDEETWEFFIERLN